MVVASIDLMGGKAVQLRQGKDVVLEVEDPLELAEKFAMYGEIAVIDLDAAMGKGTNLPLIKRILRRAECRVGGGIRTVERAKELIALGAHKVIIGSKAFEGDKVNRAFLKELTVAVPSDRIIIAVDAIGDEIVTQGWKHKTGLNLYETAKEIESFAAGIMFTNVENEGTMEGINMKAVKKLVKETSNHITVAGGIHKLDEIRDLARLQVDVQLGMAIYTGKLKLEDTFVESLNWKSDLLPVVVQDTFGQVLMLAYTNKESLHKTFDKERMCYYSRSRKELWTKGETSGNYQSLVRMRADCDRDSLLATVEQKGVACHTGSYSCFGDKIFTYQDLYDTVEDRVRNPVPDSYTAKMHGEALDAKIMEEAQEVVDSETRSEIIWEVADLMYFLCVKMVRNRVPLKFVFHELRRRRKK